MREAKSVSYGNKMVVIPSIFNGKTASNLSVNPRKIVLIGSRFQKQDMTRFR